MTGKFALIIGNTEYTDSGLAQLTAPGKDAEDFARVLKDQNICAFDEVNILLNEPEYIVRGAVEELFDQKKPDDLIVLYFSGHGVRDELGALYLAVKNTNRFRLRSTALKSDFIREAMDQSRSKRQVLILDCCNSGAFAQGTKAATGVSIGTASAFESGYGRIILTASDSTQFAWEGDKVIGETDNSLFTHFLVEGLEGEGDLDGDGRITVDELYDYAYEKVKLVTPKQTPSKFSSKQQGEIVLRRITRIEDIKPVSLPDHLISEIENPYPEVRLRAVQQLAKLMNGKNLGMARSAREALERIEKDDDSRRVSQSATHILEPTREAERAEEERLTLEKAEAERLMAEQKARKETRARVKPRPQQDAVKKADVKESEPIEIPKITSRMLGLIVITLALCGFATLNYLSGILGGFPATESPAVTEAPATEAPATEAPAPTEAPTEPPTEPPAPEPLELTLWHAYEPGSASEAALNILLERAAADLPQYRINVLPVPSNDIFINYDAEVSSGSGPDMLIARNDAPLGDYARRGVIADITDPAAGRLDEYSEISKAGMTVDGRLYGIPASLNAVVIWYNKDFIETPPATTDELKALMEGGTPVGISFGCYYHYGFFGSFGGRVFDENWMVIADQGGVADALAYLNDLYQISVANGWPRIDDEVHASFMEGQLAIVSVDNKLMGDYRNTLGDRLGVAPLPIGPNGDAATPLLSVDGYYFNPNSPNQEAALEVALYLTNGDSQTVMMNEAGYVPANITVEITDPLIQALLDAFAAGDVRMQGPDIHRYWDNFCSTGRVFDEGVPAADWVAEATANANK